MKFELWGKTYNFGSKVIIVDLDGTLADGRWRLHMLPKENLHLTESWLEFNKAAEFDPPIEDTIKVVNGLHYAGYTTVVLTGRSDDVYDETEWWLYKHGVHCDHLIMRRNTDNRKDTIIKEEVLRAIGLENILCAFDDSPNVIQHFRSLGITTYAVTQYEEERDDLKSHGVEELSE